MKVLFLLDFIRPEYIKGGKLQLSKSSDGRALTQIAYGEGGFNLKPADTYVTYAYPKCPEVLPNGKNKPITKSQIIKYRDNLHREVINFNPDLIVSFGNVALTGIYGKGGIATLRGNPSQTEVIDPDTNEVHKYWVIPTYGFTDVRVNPNKQGEFNADLDLALRYIQEGEKAFNHEDVKYENVSDFNRVKEIFMNILGLPPVNKPAYSIIGFDTETNSLEPYKDGAKVLSISLSWKTHQGVFIPLYHHETPFNKEQVDQIMEWVKAMLSDTRYFKVLHNAKYDISFIMMNYGLENAYRIIDTMVMHYVGVSEENKAGRGLKTLAYQYTDMGGYDNELDNYKAVYLENHKKEWIAKMEKRKEETGESYRKSDYPAPVNEVDGSSFNYDWIPINVLGEYAAGDTDVTLRVFKALLPTIKSYKPWEDLVFKFYPNLINSLSRLTSTGVNIDLPYLQSLEPLYREELKHIIDRIHEVSPSVDYMEQERADLIEQAALIKAQKRKVADRTEEDKAIIKKADKYRTSPAALARGEQDKSKFNPGSSDDKRELLFGIIGYDIPHDIKEDKDFLISGISKKGLRQQDITYHHYKTDKKVLEYLVNTYHSEVAQLLMDYSALNKLYNSYIIALPDKVDSKGRLHPTFNYTGTVTSRLSSNNPNAQQLPRKEYNSDKLNWKYPLKKIFRSRFKNGVMLNTDYKSLEIFIAAGISQDRSMLQTLLDGKDYHEQSAREAFDIPDDEEVPKPKRTQAKKVSFGLIYGMGPEGLANDLSAEGIKINETEAEELIQKVLNSKPGLEDTINKTQEMARTKHYVETIAGFRRRLGTVGSSDKGQANRALRQSFNARVQGSGAYCTNNALIIADRIFQQLHLKSRIVMTVHDSVVTDVHPDEIEIVGKVMKGAFEHLKLPQLLNNKTDGLNVPEKYDLGNGYFRLPLSGEMELGCNYNDDIDYDLDLIKKYVNPYQCCKWQYERIKAKEVLNTALGNIGKNDKLSEVEVEQSKEKAQEDYDLAIKEIEINEKPYLVGVDTSESEA